MKAFPPPSRANFARRREWLFFKARACQGNGCGGTYGTRRYRPGFTLIELLVVIAIIAILAAILLPALAAAKSKGAKIGCLNNHKQMIMYTQMYTDDFGEHFPTANTGLPGQWWGPAICGGKTNCYQSFHDPALNGKVTYNNTTWTWAFTFDLVSYGYNSFFLDCAPNSIQSITVGGINFSTAYNFKRTRVLQPADCLVFGDKQPKPNNLGDQALTASGSLWWGKASMLVPSSSGQYEGIDTRRHNNGRFPGSGNMSFTDGHAESKKESTINPPVDPQDGGNAGLINSRYWDPLKRGGDR